MEVGVHGVPPLPMGIRKVDRHEGAGLMTWKGSKAALMCRIWGQPGRLLERRNLR